MPNSDKPGSKRAQSHSVSAGGGLRLVPDTGAALYADPAVAWRGEDVRSHPPPDLRLIIGDVRPPPARFGGVRSDIVK